MNKKELMYKENTPGYIIELKEVSKIAKTKSTETILEPDLAHFKGIDPGYSPLKYFSGIRARLATTEVQRCPIPYFSALNTRSALFGKYHRSHVVMGAKELLFGLVFLRPLGLRLRWWPDGPGSQKNI